MKILDRLPIVEDRTTLRFGDRHVTVHRGQILVWLSVHLPEVLEPEPNTPKFPALLDTGHNYDFALQHRYLREWAGIDPRSLPPLPGIRIDGRPVDRHVVTVWVYPNVPGERKVDTTRPPHLLNMATGIAVYPSDATNPGPRLPLLGGPTFLSNDLDWWLDPERRNITVQTKTWRRHLMRLLCRF